MFGADVVMAHPTGLFDGQLEHLLGTGCQFETASGVATDAGQPLDHLLHPGWIEAQLAQHLSGDAPFLSDQAEQNMLGADVVVVQALSFFVGQTEDSPRPLSEAFHFVGHDLSSPRTTNQPRNCLILPKFLMSSGGRYFPMSDRESNSAGRSRGAARPASSGGFRLPTTPFGSQHAGDRTGVLPRRRLSRLRLGRLDQLLYIRSRQFRSV